MAANLNDPNQQQQPGGAFSPTQGPNNASNPNQYTSQPRPKGTGFTNLSQIINANQGNQLGNAVGGGVQKLAGQAQTGLQQTQNQFNQQTQQAQQQTTKDVDASQRALQQIAQNYGGQQPTNDQQQQSQNQQQYVDQSGNVNQDAIQAFTRLGRGQYQGPQNLGISGQLQSNLNEAQNLGQLAGSQNKGALLQRFVGSPGYNTGERRLDELLLGQTAAPQLAQAARAGTQLGSQLNTAQSQAQLQAQQGQQQLQQGKQQVAALTGSNEQDLDQSLAGRQQQELAQQQGLYNQMQQALQAGTAKGQPGYDSLMQLYAQQGGNAGNTQFLNQQDFLSALGGFQQGDINKSAVANNQDLARANALQSISGALGNQYNAGLDPNALNTAQQNKFLGIGLNTPAVQQAQSARQAQYQQQGVPVEQSLAWSNKALNLLNRLPNGGALNEIANNAAYGDDYVTANDIIHNMQKTGNYDFGVARGGHNKDQNIDVFRQAYANSINNDNQSLNTIRNALSYNGLG